MPLYDAVKDLTLTIERVELEPHVLPLKHLTRQDDRLPPARVGRGGRRRGRHLRGGAPPATWRLPDLTGEHTVDSFSELVADQPGYRIWGLESAALDLALRQAGSSLADAVGREPRPVTFVVSQSAVKELLEIYPGIRFKLDASDKWTDERRRGARCDGAVDVVDFKGLYDGDWVEATPSAELYGRVAEAFPQAWLEDARINDETRAGARAAPRPAHLGLPDPLGRRRRGARMAAALPQLEAVALRERAAALRLLRPLRGERDRGLRRRPVRARPGPRPDPAPRLALPPRGAERRRAEGVQRGRPEAGPAAEPAAGRLAPIPASAELQRPITSRGALKRGERERAVGVDPEDEGARWLEAHDSPPPPRDPKAAKKSKAVHRFQQQQQRKG